MEMKETYQSPEADVLDLVYEGIVCSSNEQLDEEEGVW
jgi:hypothetical protein